jgi:hypothetical protein
MAEQWPLPERGLREKARVFNKGPSFGKRRFRIWLTFYLEKINFCDTLISAKFSIGAKCVLLSANRFSAINALETGLFTWHNNQPGDYFLTLVQLQLKP